MGGGTTVHTPVDCPAMVVWWGWRGEVHDARSKKNLKTVEAGARRASRVNSALGTEPKNNSVKLNSIGQIHILDNNTYI